MVGISSPLSFHWTSSIPYAYHHKYLLYLGWCILGFDADDTLALGLAGETELHRIDDTGDLEGGDTYALMFDDPPRGEYSSVPHELTVLSHGGHGCSGHRGHQGTDDHTF